MAIRRFREHVTAHNWFAVGVDLAIVAVGVFLGLQASNWNQARIDRGEAAEYRAQVIENLRVNEAEIAARSAYYRQVRGHAVAALTALQQPASRRDEQFLINAYQASQVWLRPLQRTAFDAPIEGGVWRSTGDASTRSDLSDYFLLASAFDRTALGITAYRDRLRRAMNLRVQEAIRGKCGDIVRELPGGTNAPVLPATCRIDLEPGLVEDASRQLSAVPELDQDLTRLIVDIDQKLALFVFTSREAAGLRASLEAL